MANIVRKFQKIFGSNALNNGQFGSLQTGAKITDLDPEVLQALSAYINGWDDAVLSGEELPSLEEFQGLQYKTDYQLAYMLQKGLPEWNIDTDYHIGDISRPVAGSKLYQSIINDNLGFDLNAAAYNAGTSYSIDDVAADVNGDIYRSLTNGNMGNPLTDVINWELVWKALLDLDISLSGSNAIINGNFDIWQRNISFNDPNQEYTADRWKGSFGVGNTVIYSQSAFTLGQTEVPNEPTYYLSINKTAGVGDAPELEQPIESVRTFAGEVVTLSFFAKADSNRQLDSIISQVFGAGGSGDVLVSNVSHDLTTSWQKFIVTTNCPSIAGKTIGTNDNIEIKFSWGDNSNGTIDIAQVQIEKGKVATDFEIRQKKEELALCKRFYEKTYTLEDFPGTITAANFLVGGTSGVNNAVHNTRLIWDYQVEKRDMPTITFYNHVTGAAGSWSGATNVASLTGGDTNRLSIEAITPVSVNAQVFGHAVVESEI